MTVKAKKIRLLALLRSLCLLLAGCGELPPAALQRSMALRMSASDCTPRPSSEKPATRPAMAAMSVSSPSPFCPSVIQA